MAIIKNLHFVGYWKNQEIELVVIGCDSLLAAMSVKQTKNQNLSQNPKEETNFRWRFFWKLTYWKINYADSPESESSCNSSQNEKNNEDINITIQTVKYYAIIYDGWWYSSMFVVF